LARSSVKDDLESVSSPERESPLVVESENGGSNPECPARRAGKACFRLGWGPTERSGERSSGDRPGGGFCGLGSGRREGQQALFRPVSRHVSSRPYSSTCENDKTRHIASSNTWPPHQHPTARRPTGQCPAPLPSQFSPPSLASVPPRARPTKGGFDLGSTWGERGGDGCIRGGNCCPNLGLGG